MCYTERINFYFSVFFNIFYLFYLHYMVLALVGLFARKSFPRSDRKNKFGLIIPAKNEEAVIANIIKSIREADYPQELLDIFVVAHNCSDKTAAIARQFNVHVYEYNDPEKNTMGYAIRYVFERIEEDFGSHSFDGYFIFNADNTFDRKYFDKMNDAFEYYDRKSVISSFRQAANLNQSVLPVIYGAYFATSCYLSARGRTVLNTSNRVFGCGYLFNNELIKDGWKYVSLTEDLEFSSKEILNETPIRYCDDAVFYDEQPISFKVMWTQRLRWARGILLVSRENFINLAKAVFEPDRKNRYAVYDMATFNSRPTFVMIAINLIRLICLSFSPLFGESIVRAFSGALSSFIEFLMSFGTTSIVIFLFTMFCGRKWMASVPLPKVIAAMLLFPLFLLFQFILDIQALFSKNLTWKTVPHTGIKDT